MFAALSLGPRARAHCGPACAEFATGGIFFELDSCSIDWAGACVFSRRERLSSLPGISGFQLHGLETHGCHAHCGAIPGFPRRGLAR
jgi:hypothetical protein